MTDKSLHEKTVWITGASRGIGRAVGLALAGAGAHVVLGARNTGQINHAADAITANGGRATAMELDVSDHESVRTFAAAARDAAGLPDALINNAGAGVFRPLENFLPDEFESQFRVNVFGTFYMTKAAVPLMKQNGGGHIINVSSLAGENAARMGSGYFSSKWAVHGFTRCIFEELREDDIKVTLLCPGSVDTRFHHESHPGSHDNKDQSWMVSPEDVAKTVLHVLTLPPEALVSKLDIRPQRKPK